MCDEISKLFEAIAKSKLKEAFQETLNISIEKISHETLLKDIGVNCSNFLDILTSLEDKLDIFMYQESISLENNIFTIKTVYNEKIEISTLGELITYMSKVYFEEFDR